MNGLFTACLLAGGKSTRMGRDKAGMPVGEAPLWQHQLATLSRTGAGEILISGRAEGCYAGAGIRIVEDEIKDCGPLSGVAAVLEAAAHPLVLGLAIDLPLMTADYLRCLLGRAFETGAGVVPEQQGRFEGLAAIYPKAAKEPAAATLRGSDHSMQHFIAACIGQSLAAPMPVSAEEAPLFQNMNTLGEYLKIVS